MTRRYGRAAGWLDAPGGGLVGAKGEYPHCPRYLLCEDAARRIASALAADSRIRAYRVRVDHQESLHAHDAVASVTSATWAAPGVAEAAATDREEAMA